jgi:hypothetical protein
MYDVCDEIDSEIRDQDMRLASWMIRNRFSSDRRELWLRYFEASGRDADRIRRYCAVLACCVIDVRDSI